MTIDTANGYRVACVTGGAGFIGSHLVRALLARGLDVRVLDNLSVGRRENIPSEAQLVEGDITDSASAARAVEGCDIVFHLAARVAIRSSFEFAFEDAMTNVAGTAQMLRAVEAAKTPRKFIATSSMAVYADSQEPIPVKENGVTAPVSPYGVNKLATESLTQVMCARAQIPSVVLRLFNTFGPGQALSPYVGVVTIFIDALTRGESPTIFGDGEQCRDFVHVEDVARAFLGAMDADVSDQIYNVGSGRGLTVNRVFDGVARALGSDIPAKHADAVPGEVRYSVADIAKAREQLGYRPTREFETSIAELVSDTPSR